MSEWDQKKYVPKAGEPELPPQLMEYVDKTGDEVMKELNRLPFFMTELDETDGNGGENTNLEALRSLAYEGEPHEIAENFKNQGNDHYKVKNYKVAVDYYAKGLDVECNDNSINLLLYLNRAACNLELRNYRRCIEDCKNALMIDSKNVKACYRSGKAFFLIGRLQEAKQILEYGLSIDANNISMKDILGQTIAKENQLKLAAERKQKEHEDKLRKKAILNQAIKLRDFKIIRTLAPGEMIEKAELTLYDPLDVESQILFPVIIFYPTADSFDFFEKFSELGTPKEILTTLFEKPGSFENPKFKYFSLENVQCFLETESGGLIKIGKNVTISEVLQRPSPKVPLFDNALKMYVVPKQESPDWLSKWNKQQALAHRITL